MDFLLRCAGCGAYRDNGWRYFSLGGKVFAYFMERKKYWSVAAKIGVFFKTIFNSFISSQQLKNPYFNKKA